MAKVQDDVAVPTVETYFIYVTYIDSSVEKQGSHECLKAVGHGVFKLQVMAQVWPVSVQHEIL